MGDLYYRRCINDFSAMGITKLGTQESQERPKALTPSLDEVARCFGNKGILALDRLA
jgi:hypothetical protein